ncbi:hypothetical protein, partial [Phycicoccus sp. Root101]|uniref:hypothetical protein n=1 Tax=Phycicoccus sp. Root101 TaxID=1736421 RepID=UPI000AE3358B
LAPTLAVFRSYPEPLRHPFDTQLSLEQAAALTGKRAAYFRRRVQHGNLHVVHDAGVYLVKTRDLDVDPDITPAELGDPHPLARISCTLGAAADLAVAQRQVEQARFMDDAQLAGTYIHILSLTYSAARHALAHGAVVDADRPLAISRYAEESIDALREGAQRPLALERLTATSPEPAPATINERLEAAVEHWTIAAELELLRLVPSADTLRMLANQGALLYAVTHQVLTAPHGNLEDALDGASTSLVAGARAFQSADKSWARLTTASRSSTEFVAASRELFNALNEVGVHASEPADVWDRPRGLRDLTHGVETLGRVIMELSQTLPDRLLRSGLVFAPARALPVSVTRMPAKSQGKFVAVSSHEVPDLQMLWNEAYRQTQQVKHSMARPDLHPGPSPVQRLLEL